jgi:hypothetical protein
MNKKWVLLKVQQKKERATTHRFPLAPPQEERIMNDGLKMNG